MKGKLIVISAPSGAGKTTIVRRLLEARPDLEFSVSAASRPKRQNEKDGVDYHFMSVDEFKEKIEHNEFLEWEEVYHRQYYGTLIEEVQKIWEKGKHAIFDVDVKGGMTIKAKYPSDTLSIFIEPPSIGVLKDRLMKRSTEDGSSLQKRIEKATYELGFAGEFDRRIINDDLETAVKEALDEVNQFLGGTCK